ncbi:hypothetical protein H072_562 [Dactylellina haptotyla CBS 200.50]|uniref:DNA damage-binding protein CMR1 n=1 Tax=Dactylellina haptotyla (strain CBS 200.50) TaxID=1284197 RepID=S8AR46_DACHA|nr:hypothetical protein H072_562 [Dactylellina haptotyla CBS 200.50]
MDNDYERQRLENIEKNRKLLQELELTQASNAFRAATEQKKAAVSSVSKASSKKRTRPPPVKKEEEEFTPRRTSSRIRGIAADSEIAKRKADAQEAAFKEVERAKRQRVAGELSLSDIAIPGKEWDRTTNFLSDVKGERYARTFTDDDVNETTDADLKAIRKKLMGLKLHEKFDPVDIKITPERIYCMAFHPVTSKQLTFAGDKIGNLGIFDASNPLPNSDYNPDEDDEALSHIPNVATFKLHSRSIATLTVDPTSAESLYSTSYDGSIRKLDLVAHKSDEVFAAEDAKETLHKDAAISGMDFYDPNIIYFSTLTGEIGRKDLRDKAAATIWECHEKKIGGFTLNPRNPYLAATASLDRTMKIWDLRKITGKGENAKPHMVLEHESRLSVSSAIWSSNGKVATTGYDDTVKVFDFGESKSWKEGYKLEDVKPDVTIKHNNQTGRWVTILRAQWQQSPTGPQKFCIGNMNRFVDIYSETGEMLAQLGGELVTAVPAVAQFHPTQDWIVGGTASGKVCLWT